MSHPHLYYNPTLSQAKYQKRTYRDDVAVARNADQVEEYCRCVCGHLKCCYNLFSPYQFSGDDCPSNCRGNQFPLYSSGSLKFTLIGKD